MVNTFLVVRNKLNESGSIPLQCWIKRPHCYGRKTEDIFSYSCLHWTGHRVSHPQLWWLRVPGKILNSSLFLFLYAVPSTHTKGIYLIFIYLRVFSTYLSVYLSAVFLRFFTRCCALFWSFEFSWSWYGITDYSLCNSLRYWSICRLSTYVSFSMSVYLLVFWSAESPCLSPTSWKTSFFYYFRRDPLYFPHCNRSVNRVLRRGEIWTPGLLTAGQSTNYLSYAAP